MERVRIVVGVDGSSAAREAVRWAAWLGGILEAEVVAVHAVGLLEDAHDPQDTAGSWRTRLRDLIEHTWCAGLDESACDHRVVVKDGTPVDVLLAVAKDERADLVVVGNRGVGTTNPALTLGSTSLRVLQSATVPVLVAPDRPEGASSSGFRLDRLVVGVDRSQPSLGALAWAADLAEATGAALTALEVFEYVPPFPLGPSTTATNTSENNALQATQALLEAEARCIRERGVGVQVVVRSGEPVATLLEVADDMDADLVVVGTRGRGDPADPLLGSVARALVDRVRRPTLVVPAAAGRAHLPRAGPGPGRAESDVTP